MHKKKEKEVVVFMILNNSYYDPVIDNNYVINDHFFYAFSSVFRLKTRLNAQEGGKVSVFHSQSGTSTNIQTRPLFLDFPSLFGRLNAFLKNFICLGIQNI